jgi:hypothetical protein
MDGESQQALDLVAGELPADFAGDITEAIRIANRQRLDDIRAAAVEALDAWEQGGDEVTVVGLAAAGTIYLIDTAANVSVALSLPREFSVRSDDAGFQTVAGNKDRACGAAYLTELPVVEPALIRLTPLNCAAAATPLIC